MTSIAASSAQTLYPSHERDAGHWPLLGDLDSVPRDYQREVAQTKRALERWVCDARMRDSYWDAPPETLRRFDLDLTPEQFQPLIDRDEALALNAALAAGNAGAYASSVLRYRAFIREKIRHRHEHRLENCPAHPLMAKWWWRQVYRLAGEVGPTKADRIVHAPLTVELTRGCSVHCWFCALRAGRLEAVFDYSAENARLWRESLDVLRGVLGATAAGNGFCYWATEPLDNPDYERFLVDFHAAFGNLPQTTTAKPTADVERTRRLLLLSRALGGAIDRFSILTRSMLDEVHRAFSAEELLRVELLPQNREADAQHKKANIGRAQDHAQRRAAELGSGAGASTTACVSGFLLNMVDRSVQLITPCAASAQWPEGFRVIAQRRFDDARELAAQIDKMIARYMPATLELHDLIRLRPNIQVRLGERGDVRLVSQLTLPIPQQPQPERLGELLAAGVHSSADIAEARLAEAAVEPERTLLLLQELFEKGVLMEPEEIRADRGEPAAAVA